MKYVARLKLLPTVRNETNVSQILQRNRLHYRQTSVGGVRILEVDFEKDDPRLQLIMREISSLGEEVGPPLYEPVFDAWEIDKAEVLHLFVRGLGGRSFDHWATTLGLPRGTAVVMDKRAMGKKDIALTYGFEVIISERLKKILEDEGLTGWTVRSVIHRNLKKDSFPPFFQLTATNILPPLAQETDILALRRTGPMGAYTALYQRGPLVYYRRDVETLEDFNGTSEKFGEPVQAQAELLISRRCWLTLRKHKIRQVDVEPVVIVGGQDGES